MKNESIRRTEKIKVKTLVLFIGLFLSGSSFGNEIADMMATTLRSDEIKQAIDRAVGEGNDSDHRYFKGIAMSDLQTGCMGDRVFLDLRFDRLVNAANGGLSDEKCKITVTFGECGVASGKVNSIGKLICQSTK